MKPLAALLAQGQSPWLDYIRRSLLTDGGLERMVTTDGITGVTINPTIFEKAIAESTDYDEALKALLAREPQLAPAEIYERLAIEDVTMAADILRPVYDRTSGADGFVSLEVAPGLAHDTPGTIAEARRLWAAVHRPNLLIKVPGTPEGIPAIEQLLSENINVNITLMFSIAHYEAVAHAYLAGLARSSDPGHLASVASIFVSRIDTAVDKLLGASSDPRAPGLKGKIAIANSRVVYARFQELFEGTAFSMWAKRGARPQRLLWASTSTKDPKLRDTLYVEELVGPVTVDTIPPSTLAAFQDHGEVRGNTVTEDLAEAREALRLAKELGIDLVRVTESLQTEGVAAFAASYAQLLASLESRKNSILARPADPPIASLGGAAPQVDRRLRSWQEHHVGDRIWRNDPTLWPAATAQDVTSRLGWLQLPDMMRAAVPELVRFAEEVRAEGTSHVVVLGMGGSSLAPDVFHRIFGHRPGFPELLVLDSTHPDAIRAIEGRVDLRHTLFLVSSKSGTTTEPRSLHRYFARVLEGLGESSGRHFVAVTDPGTPLEKLAAEEKFRATFRALGTVGGRYSALTMFGLVPAALAGVDISMLLDRAGRMARACGPTVSASESPALRLGATLGELAIGGRDKLTFYASPSLAPFPDWVEQLVAESTGKAGRGIVPIVDEPMLGPEVYGPDRLFVEIEEGDGVDVHLAAHTAALEAAGHPVVRLRARELADLGQEFFRWELAVASSGMILGIDPFDQPDVELAKELARRAMAPAAAGAPAPAVATVPGGDAAALATAVRGWLGSCRPGDYIGIQAYLAPSAATWNALEGIRRRALERMHVATTLGYGPRFLHSTGQLHKGGPNTGLFLQLIDAPLHDLEVPGAGYSFGQLIRAQSLGDYQALRAKGRRVLRVDLGTDVGGGLARLEDSLHG